MSATTSSDLPNWLALQKAKNAADGIGGDNLLTPPPAATRPSWWDNPVGAERLNDTYAGMPSSDVSPVIGSYGARPVTAAMRGNALDIASAASQFGPADMASIRAFHGSPYDFNAFDTSKIGTGEGAQAYGHGHYAAENEGVARGYRDDLSPPADISVGGQPVNKEHLADIADRLNIQRQSTVINTMLSRMQKSADATSYFSQLNDIDTSQLRNFPAVQMGVEAERALAAELQKRGLEISNPNPGKMYELAIHADPEHFLDWDAPLSEQSQHVQDTLLGPLGVKRSPQSQATGEMVYKSLGYGQKPEEIAQRLRDAGIPGIKYLDQGSRASGQGTSNYVIFDPKTIEILRKYGIAGLMAGGAAAVGTDNQ